MEKKKLLVSFSGGETSAYMAQWIWKHKKDEFDMIFVFANTGQENEETLQFVNKCESYFNFPITWVEALVYNGQRKGTSHNIVNFQTASRDGEPFEDVISKYGIPNNSYPHCTRELKLSPINSYAKSIGWKNYYTAIGIREDEIDRMNPKRYELRLMYPLISYMPMTKPKINFWWQQQPFRLNLKGYQGNCITCWKKHDPKLFQIAREDERNFLFFQKMELRYNKYIPETRIALMRDRGELPSFPINFFRKNRSVQDIISQSKIENKPVYDDADIYDETESCEIFSECHTKTT